MLHEEHNGRTTERIDTKMIQMVPTCLVINESCCDTTYLCVRVAYLSQIRFEMITDCDKGAR